MNELAALFALELRTPRLLLRLGDEDEVRALARLAERGIHPPEEMPFSVAWSDRIGSPSFVDEFVAFHREALGAWRPHDWSLNLLVWHGDELVGSQSLRAELFADAREVATGSWLGRAFQRRGLGTEMRAAVLELAFRDLGAEAATSAWLEGNEASRRVSARLGYAETHTTTHSPRGVPVVAHNVRLERSGWHCPVPVRGEGLSACLPLFGLTAAG